jgi:dTDP-4-amino-4,6-dideoxygalactose transaminase
MAAREIPQADPRASYMAQKKPIDRAVKRVLAGGRYILDGEVAGFEREFAAYVGAGFGVGVASGTDALVLALRALDLRPGDFVAAPSHTAIATVAAIELAGLKPLLLDIEPGTFTLDPRALERALAHPPGRIAAVIPVHLYGQAADLPAILELTQKRGIRVIEDCAQSHGAKLEARRLGSFGDLACFSFYPTKNLGALGDGGLVATSDKRHAARLRELREYGWTLRRLSNLPGMNSRLDELQAAILRVKLRRLDANNARRQRIAMRYEQGLGKTGLVLPARRERATHVFHQYVVRSPRRDDLRAGLAHEGIGTGVHYPVPVHLQPAYQGRIALGAGGLAETEKAAREVLSLPMFPELSVRDAARVVAAVKAVVQTHSPLVSAGTGPSRRSRTRSTRPA